MQRSLFVLGLSSEEPESALGQVLLWDGMTVSTGLRRALLPHLQESPWRHWRRGHLQAALEALRVHLQQVPEKEAAWTRGFANPLDPQAMMKLCRLLDHHGISIAAVPDTGTLHVAGWKIENRALDDVLKAQRQRDAAESQKAEERAPEVKSIEDLVPHVLRRLFTDLDDWLSNASPEERDRVADQIAQDLNILGADVREQVRQAAGLDDLSMGTLVRAGRLAALGTGLSAATGVGGFAVYTTLSSTIATVSGIVGLTLPFSVYVTAMSLLAFASNPLVVLAAVGGGGACLMKWANTKMRAELFSIFVAVAALKSMLTVDAEARDRVSQLAEHLADRYREFLNCDRHRQAQLRKAFPAFRSPGEGQRAT